MLNFEFLILFTKENFSLILVAFFCNIGITIFRSKRILSLSKYKKIEDIVLFFSFHRVINFILPFKSADIIKIYFFKKVLKKNNYKSILSLYVSTKFLDLLLFASLSLIIFISFVFLKIDILSFLVVILFVTFFLISKKKKIFNSLKEGKNFIRKISKSYKLSKKIFDEIDYIANKSFLQKTIYISILNYIFTLIIIFLATDLAIDRELFFLVFLFSFLQAIPLRLFFGIGFFDIIVYITNLYFGIGINIEQLTFFRLTILVILISELINVMIYYLILNFKNVISQKYKKK